MISSEILSVATGVTSLFGLTGLIVYVYYTIVIIQAKQSIAGLIEGERLFTAGQVVAILQEFDDDSTRLEALKALTQYDTTKTKVLYGKIKANININALATSLSGHYKVLAGWGTILFFGLAVLTLWYQQVHITPPQKANVDLPNVVNFTQYQSRYTARYEQISSNLEKEVMVPLMDKLPTISRVEYDNAIIAAVKKSKNRHVDIVDLARFFEDILMCEQRQDPGCEKDKVNDFFGGKIRDFWFSYRPYIQLIRQKGYANLANLVELRAIEYKKNHP